MAAMVSLVGRHRELSGIRAAFADVVRGQARQVLLRGEAGVGKSRIVREVLREYSTTLALSGRCPAPTSATPMYAPLVQIVRPLVGSSVITRLPQHQQEALRPVLPLLAPTRWNGGSHDVDPSGTVWAQARLFEVVLAVLRSLARPAPVVLVIEDVHWADAGTAALLEFLVGNLAHERVLLLLTHRTDEVGVPVGVSRTLASLAQLDRCQSFDVEPLGEQDSRELVREVASGSEVDADEILRLGSGNPLFIEQLVLGGRTSHQIPVQLKDLLSWRVQRLSAVAQAALEVLAVAATRLPYAMVIGAVHVDVDALDAALSELVSGRLIDEVPQDTFTVHHELLREVVYLGIRPGRRRQIHGSLALLLAKGASDAVPYAEIARHWQLAGRDDAAFAPMLTAALGARMQGRQAEASSLFGRLLEIWPADGVASEETRCDVLAWRADTLRWTVEPEQVTAAYRRAVRAADQLGDERRRGVVRERFARSLVDTGHQEAAATVAHDAVHILRAFGDADTARALATLGAIRMVQADYRGSARDCETALRIAERSGALLVGARACRILGVDYANLGRLDDAVRCLERSLEICTDESAIEDQIHTHINLSYVLERAGRWGDAVTSARTGRRIAAFAGLQASLGTALLCNEISSLMASGRWAEAAEASRPPTAVAAPRDSELYFDLITAELAVLTGELSDADRRLAACTSAPHEADNLGQRRIAEIMLARARGDALTAFGTSKSAVAELGGLVEPYLVLRLCAEGLGAFADVDSPAARSVLVDRYGADGAEMLLTEAATRAESVDDLEPCRLLGELCSLEARRSAGAATASEWVALGERARDGGQLQVAAYADLRAAAVAGRNHVGPILHRARTTAIRIGARPLVDEIERLAARRGVAMPDVTDGAATALATSDAQLAPFGLTARERQVLQCLTTGMSNRLIARALSITEKTASVHVSNILRKLDVHTRAEAVYAVHQLTPANPTG